MASLSSEDQFRSFTGASPAESAMFLEMAGGNVEAAVSLYFSMAGGGDFGGGPTPSNISSNAASQPDFLTLAFGSQEPPAAWLEQKIEFLNLEGDEAVPYGQLGLVQTKNGPCGVLAALNAVLVAQLMESSLLAPEYTPNDMDLARAIATLIEAPCRRVEEADSCRVATWTDDDSSSTESWSSKVVFTVVKRGVALVDFIKTNITHFTRASGLLLVIFSAIETRGPDMVKKDMRMSGGEPPLITGPFSLCTSDLMSLLLRGTADGNVGAYPATGGTKVDWPADVPVGLLSMSELEAHTPPVCDRLKSPKTPVWILHGRDHFTYLFCAIEDKGTMANKAELSSTEQKSERDGASVVRQMKTLQLFHYNGLKPNGPRMSSIVAQVRVTKEGLAVVAAPAPERHEDAVGSFFTPRVGEIFDVVQADQAMKKDNPKGWKSAWRYEVMLVVNDPDGKLYGTGKQYEEGHGPETFAQGAPIEGERWRCARCYVKRNETMAFKLNEAESTTCMHCSKNRADCGWSVWMTYDQLPTGWQRRMDRRYQPDVTTLLGTKWPGVELTFDGEPPSV